MNLFSLLELILQNNFNFYLIIFPMWEIRIFTFKPVVPVITVMIIICIHNKSHKFLSGWKRQNGLVLHVWNINTRKNIKSILPINNAKAFLVRAEYGDSSRRHFYSFHQIYSFLADSNLNYISWYLFKKKKKKT